MKEQWEKEIQQKLADYSVPAPELSWTEIEAAIDKSQKCRVVMLRRRRITVAAAIVLLIMGLCFVDLQPSVEKIAKDGKEKTEKIEQHHSTSMDRRHPQESIKDSLREEVQKYGHSGFSNSKEPNKTLQSKNNSTTGPVSKVQLNPAQKVSVPKISSIKP